MRANQANNWPLTERGYSDWLKLFGSLNQTIPKPGQTNGDQEKLSKAKAS